LRHPTSDGVLYRWHTLRLNSGSLADEAAPFVNDPQCGWYKTMLVKGGPFVPVAIFIERDVAPDTGELLSDEILRAEVNGMSVDPEGAWLWCWETPISESEYLYMRAVTRHVAEHAPHEPEANPKKKIDWLSVRPPTFNKRK
jgi:hypothetical protein